MAPFGGKPPAVIHAFSPLDEITSKCSAQASWKLQLEHTAAAFLRALAVHMPLLSSTLAAHSQRHAGAAGHRFPRLEKRLQQHIHCHKP